MKKNNKPFYISLDRILYLISEFFSAGIYLELPYKLLNLKWRFHKKDVDDQLSIPHGDCVDGKKKYQLNSYSGIMYCKKIEVGKLKKSEYKRLWTDKKIIKFVKDAREVYFENNPTATLPDIPVFQIKRKKNKSYTLTINENECEIGLETEVQNEEKGE